MPSKKRKALSHEQIWDDTALIESWDDALEEYKLYHSIHARGEKVEDILRQAAEPTDGANEHRGEEKLPHDDGDTQVPREEEASGGSEDGEIEEEPKEPGLSTAKQENVELHQQPTKRQKQRSCSGTDLNRDRVEANGAPPVLLGEVEDAGLKNLMMSWYYAGYYTGLYEGQKKAKGE